MRYSLVAFSEKYGRTVIGELDHVQLSTIDEFTSRFKNEEELNMFYYSMHITADDNCKFFIIYQMNGEKQEPIIYEDKRFLTRLVRDDDTKHVEDYGEYLINKTLFLIKKDRLAGYMESENLLPKEITDLLYEDYIHDGNIKNQLINWLHNYKYFRDMMYLTDKFYMEYEKHPKFDVNDQDNQETTPYEYIDEDDYPRTK